MVAVKVRLQFLDAFDIDDRRAVDTDKCPRRKTLLHAFHGLAKQVYIFADTELDIIAGVMNNPNSKIPDRDQCRANLLNYTRRAYHVLPRLANPRIPDIGCGTGVSTLELVRISGGEVVAMDIDQNALDKLVSKAKHEGLSDRITVVQRSVLEMNFPPNGFDIIWTEGAISMIGFVRGLTEWRNLLAPDGHLVVHDSLSDLAERSSWFA